jgi:hypothetical protein
MVIMSSWMLKIKTISVLLMLLRKQSNRIRKIVAFITLIRIIQWLKILDLNQLRLKLNSQSENNLKSNLPSLKMTL